MLDFIPPELLVHVFLRLPVKSLLRCRSVSKRWRSIITSSDFINTRLTNSLKNPSFMLSRILRDRRLVEHFTLHSDDRSVVDYIKLDYPWPPGQTHIPKIVGACNGLLCLTDEGKSAMTLLWNPSIRRYFILPLPSFTINCLQSCIYFGFDLKSKDYKVLRTGYFLDYEHPQKKPAAIAEVYALRIGHWKSVSSAIPSIGLDLFAREQVYINGACVGLMFKRFFRKGPRPVLLSFDLGDEVFQLMDTPEELGGSTSDSDLGIRILQNMVSVFQAKEEGFSSTISIWVMREFGVAESWTKQYSFNFEGGLYDFYDMPSFYDCYYVESLALLNGSSMNGEAPPLPADYVLPSWLSNGGNGATSKENLILSLTSVRDEQMLLAVEISECFCRDEPKIQMLTTFRLPRRRG